MKMSCILIQGHVTLAYTCIEVIEWHIPDLHILLGTSYNPTKQKKTQIPNNEWEMVNEWLSDLGRFIVHKFSGEKFDNK
jgi:hypothetical protein